MYRWLRDTHLTLGVFSFLFVLMYSVSSVWFVHRSWLSSDPTVTETRLVLDPRIQGARTVARELMDSHGMSGELSQVKETEGGYELQITRRGTTFQIYYNQQSGEASVRTTQFGHVRTLVGFHILSGLWHEFTLSKVWGVLVGLISLAFVLLGLTGIYLWFKLHKERVIGLILLTINLAYSVTIMILLRTA